MNSAPRSSVALCRSQARVQEEGWWWGADTATVKNRRMKSNGRWRRVNGKTPRYGRRRERRWTPTRAKAQDTRASPNSLEAHLVRKRGDIGPLQALSPWSNGWMDGHCSILCNEMHFCNRLLVIPMRNKLMRNRLQAYVLLHLKFYIAANRV